jgi:hypothetical protein
VKKLLVVVIAVIAVIIVLPLVSRGPRGPDEPDVAPSLGPGMADEAITLWSQNRNEEALSLLLEGKRPGGTQVTPLECLRISEEQFALLPEAERSRMAAELGTAAKAARDLARAAIARIQRVQDDRPKATLWTSRLKDFATQLAGPDHCLIIQLVGQAIDNKVSEELE